MFPYACMEISKYIYVMLAVPIERINMNLAMPIISRELSN